VIDEETFEQCQQIRQARAAHNSHFPKHRFYLVKNIIYCAECLKHKPQNVTKKTYGKMRGTSSAHQQYSVVRNHKDDKSRASEKPSRCVTICQSHKRQRASGSR